MELPIRRGVTVLFFVVVVQIHVTVEDGEGSKRRVRPIQLKVKPQYLPEGVTMEEYL